MSRNHTYELTCNNRIMEISEQIREIFNCQNQRDIGIGVEFEISQIENMKYESCKAEFFRIFI